MSKARMSKTLRVVLLAAVLLAASSALFAVAQKRAQMNKELFAAVDAGNLAKVKTLLSRGASPNAGQASTPGLKNSRQHEPGPGVYTGEDIGETTFAKTHMPALVRAIWNGDQAMVELLLSKGADVNARTTDGRTALIWAIEHGDRKTIELLLRRRPDVNAKDRDGYTALQAASWDRDLALINRLQEAGAKQ